MILAITERYGLSEKGTEKYYIDKEFKDIFEKLIHKELKRNEE